MKDLSQGPVHGKGERALHKGAATRTRHKDGSKFTERGIEVPTPEAEVVQGEGDEALRGVSLYKSH